MEAEPLGIRNLFAMKVDEELNRLKTILSRIRVGPPIESFLPLFHGYRVHNARPGSGFSDGDLAIYVAISSRNSVQPEKREFGQGEFLEIGASSVVNPRILKDENWVVALAFSRLKKLMVHECGEAFTFDYKRVFDPHNPKNQY